MPNLYYLDTTIPLEDGVKSIELSLFKKYNKTYFVSSKNELNTKICPNFSPKDKEFSIIPLKYKHGISIIITTYKAKNFIKETLDSISNQTWFKNNSNYEILLGIDNCYETLNYVKIIMKNYSNLHVFMMKSNKGTYITTNTLMTIAKYDNLLRFDSDDIMKSNMIEFLMNEIEKNYFDKLNFNMKNFGNETNVIWADGQFLIKHNVFDWFGGFMPWICAADTEFDFRIRKFIQLKKLKIYFFLKEFIQII